MNRAIAAVLVSWFVLATALVAGGMLARIPVPPPAIVAMLALATVVVVLLTRARAWVLSVDLRVLLALHLVRFVGVAFVILVYRGTLSRAFLPIGWGDAISAAGALALIVAGPTLASRGGWWGVFGWNVFGFADMLMLVATGIRLGTADPAQFALFRQLPLGLLPTFFVPLIIATHVFIFMRLLGSRRPGSAAGSRRLD